MEKKASLIIGLFLLALGGLSLLVNILFTTGALDLTSAFQLWPVIVIGAGLLFILPPFFFRHIKGLGGLFIPGVPVLMTGLLLLAGSLTNDQGYVWSNYWPMEIIALAIGFAVAAWFMDVIWLLIPSFIVGAIGLALQFTTLTGAWEAWAFLWLVIPFGLGLAFLVIGLKERFQTLTTVGAGFCGFAGLGFAAASFAPNSMEYASLLAPLFVIGTGILILWLGFSKRFERSELPPQEQQS